MKVLWFSTSSNNTPTVVESLASLNQHEIHLFHYDAVYHREIAAAVQASPDVREKLHLGQFHLPRERVGMDAQMISKAKEFQPDIMLYTSAWEGDFVPLNETLVELNSLAPLVHILYDGSDPPWWPQLKNFEDIGAFKLTVNIDGGFYWPGGGRKWNDVEGNTYSINGLTLLTPVHPAYYQGVAIPFMQRPYAVAYAGNHGGWLRNWIVTKMHDKGYFIKPRDDKYDSYGLFAKTLMQCRAVVNVPFTGSTATTHVKGRVVEAGWAGAALLEWKNDATRAWLTPRYHFWEYEGVEDCIEQCEWLKGHPKIAEEMAKALHNEVITRHDPLSFWTVVFDRVK